MADEDVCVFLSYAHNDDLVTGASKAELGFVSFFRQMLDVQLRYLGATRVKLWMDRRRVSDGDQFDDVIDEGLRQAQLLVVVMSPNWMQRPYCRKELEAFTNLRMKAGLANVRERLIVVGKGHVDRLKRPFDLQGQEGFLFYSRDESNNVAEVTPFFNRGEASDKFYEVRDKLAGFLQNRVDLIAQGKALGSALPATQPIVAPNGRTVYLAKPASDMKAAYQRLAIELQGKGYSVVPDPSVDVPSDTAALGAVKDALAKAEISVHLVGEGPGFAPEGLDPIVKMQLALAREQASAASGERVFRRLVWAPKVLGAGDPGAAPTNDRDDPLRTLAKFDAQTATDKIDGEILSKFVEFLFQYLADNSPRSATRASPGNRLEVLLSYQSADQDYAALVADALKDGSVKIKLPVVDASDADSRRLNDELLRTCGAVTLCWANATETWVRAQADRLRDWEALGRKEQFVYRHLIAGPPPSPNKNPKLIHVLFQDGEFDEIFDLVTKGPPTPEDFGERRPPVGDKP
jgi:hypothetical protein